MYYFELISNKELSELINQKQSFEVEIPENITKFKTHIPDVDFSSPKEVPPTSMIFTEEGIACS